MLRYYEIIDACRNNDLFPEIFAALEESNTMLAMGLIMQVLSEEEKDCKVLYTIKDDALFSMMYSIGKEHYA